ncbi:MAG: glycoside hydrolase family 20 zincin-like fold domain-containing protein, partial [bacterium]
MGVRVDSQRADRYRTSAAILLLLSVSAQVYAASALNVVPWPATVAITNGTFALDAGTRVVPSSPALTSLAAVLTNEYRQAFGITVGVDGNAQGPGQIVLRLTEALQGEAYRLNVSTTGAVVEAGNYAALAAASVSLLQAADFDGYRVAVPCLSISDAPFVAYRGLMIDVARQPHSLDVLKQLVR